MISVGSLGIDVEEKVSGIWLTNPIKSTNHGRS
jgi:hypothetical protein